MSARTLCWVLLLAITPLGCSVRQAPSLRAVYEAHRWNELYSLLENTRDPPQLYVAGASIALNQKLEAAEHLLFSLIEQAPHSPEAYDASEWLSHLYLRRGQYRSLVAIMKRRWTDFPAKKERAEEQRAILIFDGLPDQSLQSSRPSAIEHEPDSIFVPLSVNGIKATYFLDTGSWVSCMSESEAKRLHLAINTTSGTLGQSAGSQVAFRTTVTTEVQVGETHFRDVSFAVFPDDQEPWVNLPPGRKGIVGIPLLTGLRTIRWHKSAKVDVGEEPVSFHAKNANLTFDNDHLIVSAEVQSKTIYATVDTGAASTDLYQTFADRFAVLVRQGKRGTTEVRGVGHAETFNSVTLPRLPIQLGGYETVLSPAHVLMKPLGAACCVGNFGMDLYHQAPVMEIDFSAMILRLTSGH